MNDLKGNTQVSLPKGAPAEKMLREELSLLLAEIAVWRSRTSGFRLFNVILFAIFRIVTPLGAFVVAASLFAMAQNQPFLNPIAALLVSGMVGVVSGLDSILNPATKKRVAFKMHNNLRALGSKLRVSSVDVDVEELAKLLREASEEFRELQNTYADNGF